MPALSAGFYNIVVEGDSGNVAFQDSLVSDGKTLPYRSDTLVVPGEVTGRIRVQPQDDPKIAWVSLLGTGKNMNVDDSGRFRFEGVPRGTHSLVALTDRSEYTRTFRSTHVRSDSVSNLGDIELVYTGMPLARGLALQWDSLAGIVHLRWDSATSNKVVGWRILRGLGSYPSGASTVGSVDAATLSFSDTLIGPKHLWSETDTTFGTVSYWVQSLDRQGNPGTPWERVGFDFRPPRLVDARSPNWVAAGTLGLWSDGEYRRLDTLVGGLVAAELRWIPGGREEQVLVSSDGTSWSVAAKRTTSSAKPLGMTKGVSFAGRFWWVEYAGDSALATIRNGGETMRWDTLVIRGMDREGGFVEHRVAQHDSAQYAYLASDGRELTLIHVGGDNLPYWRDLVRRRERFVSSDHWVDDSTAASWIPYDQPAGATVRAFHSVFGTPWLQTPVLNSPIPTEWILGRPPGKEASGQVLDVLEFGAKIVVREDPYGIEAGALFWADSAKPADRHAVTAPGPVSGIASLGTSLWALVGVVLYRAENPLGE